MSIFRDVRSGYLFCMKMGNGCADHIVRNGIFEHGLIEWCQQYLSKDGVFVDVGAHIGTYSIILSSYCKKVYSFEAQRNTCEYLNEGIKANEIDNIETHNVGLGSKEDVLKLHHVSEDGGGSSFLDNITELSGVKIINEEEVKIVPLDIFNIEGINLIKIDVEGFELEVIKGASNTLERNNYPPIFLGAWPGDNYRIQREILFDHLKSLGYQIHPVSGSNNTMYLASDNPKYVSPNRSNESKNIDTLKIQYMNSEVEGFTGNDWMSLCKHFFDSKYYHDLYDCSKKAMALVKIPNHRIFMKRYFAVSCHFVGYLDESKQLYEELLTSHSSSWDLRNSMILEYSKLMMRLPLKSRKVIKFKIQEGFHHSSTSIVPDEGRYKICVRNVNYVIRDDGGYNMADPRGFVRTINYLGSCGEDLEVTPGNQLLDVSGIKKYPVNIVGMEDVRLFGRNYFLAVYPEVNETRTPQLCLGKYENYGAVDTVIPLSVTGEIKCEKNWLPFVVEGKIHVIYSFEPLKIYTIDENSGKMELVLERSAVDYSVNLSDFRGSAPPIPYKNGYLMTIHQVHYSNPRKYFHRFLWMDKKFENIKYSNLFYFQSVEIEYNLSICHHNEGLLIPYSYRDSSSVIGVLDYQILDQIVGL